MNSGCVPTIIDTVRTAEAHFGCPVGLIIIDTFNKGIAVGGGDESSAKDQNITAANLQRVQDQIDVHIALIGHTGKDESRGARGSNAHLGDVDMMVQISVDGDVRTATITMINDGVEGVLTRFKLKPVTMGQDEDGDDITTAIVSDDQLDTEKEMSRAKLNKSQRRAMELLERCLGDEGEPAPNHRVSSRRQGCATRTMAHHLPKGRLVTGRYQGKRREGVPARPERSGRHAQDRHLGRAGLDRLRMSRAPTDRTDRDKPGQSPTLSEVQFRTDTDTPL